jgi:hypothetical protein
MINRDVQKLELEFYLNFIKRAQDNPDYWRKSLEYINSSGQKVMAYAPAFKDAADKISSSHSKLEAGGVTAQDIQKALGESGQAGAQQPESVRQASGLKNKIRELKKFSRKYKSIKGDENKIKFLKRSGVIDEDGLMKLGLKLDLEEKIKKIGINNIALNGMVKNARFVKNKNLRDIYDVLISLGFDGNLADAFRTLGLEPGADASTINRAFKNLARSAHPDRAGGSEAVMKNLLEAREVALGRSQPGPGFGLAPAGSGALVPGAGGAGAPAAGAPAAGGGTAGGGGATGAGTAGGGGATGAGTAAAGGGGTAGGGTAGGGGASGRRPARTTRFRRGARPHSSTAGGGATVAAGGGGATVAAGGGGATVAAGGGGATGAGTAAGGGGAEATGMFGRLRGLAGRAANWVSASKSWIARGFRFLGKILRWLGVIIELFKGFVGLCKAIYGVVQVMSVASEVQLSTWDILSSPEPLDSKIEVFKNDPDKLTKLGYAANAAVTFWRGIVELVISPIAAALQFGVLCVASAVGAAAAAASGPLGILVSIVVGAGLGTIVYWLTDWITESISSALTSGYVEVTNKINNIIQEKINPTIDNNVKIPGGFKPGLLSEEAVPVAEVGSEGGGGGGGSGLPRPIRPQALTPTRREMRGQRRMERREQRMERRNLRREDRAARRAERRARRGRVANSTLDQMIKLANQLDYANLIVEADMVDDLIYQMTE